jgi:RHS repeat-associated protein
VTQKTDGRGVVTTFTYDAAGRMLSKSYPASAAENVTYQYDATAGSNKGKGRLTKITDGTGSVSFVYNALGQVIRETRVITITGGGSRSYVTAYVYNKAGKLRQVTYPSGRIVNVTFNSSFKPRTVTLRETATALPQDIVTAIAWRPMSGLVSSMTHGNGLVTEARYDRDYRLTRLSVSDGTALVQQMAYAYADGMNLTRITDAVDAASTVRLAYTPSNRLARAEGPWGLNTFTYDAVGNRRRDTTPAAARVATYAANSNRITGMTENGAALRSYTYDGAGNIITDTRPGEVFAYSYNAANRLASVTRNGQDYGTYRYNALEQLVSRTSQSPAAPIGEVHYLYDRDGHLIAEVEAATGVTLREYIWMPANDNASDTLAEAMGLTLGDTTAPDLPLAIVETGAITHIHTDHLGRPIRMTNAAKATVWQASYKPWGEVQSITGTITQNLRFPGQYFQIETGLAYNWHRHYDPVTGRYTQPDPLGFVDGPSVYAYAGNSPFRYIDRDGRAAFDNQSGEDVLGLGSPGKDHGHGLFPLNQDPYIPVTVPHGRKVDRCNPIYGMYRGHYYAIHDLDVIDFNSDGKVKGSPYTTPGGWDMFTPSGLVNLLGQFYYYKLGEQVGGSDVKPVYTARPGWFGPRFSSTPGPADFSSCECRR